MSTTNETEQSPDLKSKTSFTYPCPCGRSTLEVPSDERKAYVQGSEVVLYCERCRHITLVQDGGIKEWAFPRSGTRWTESFYG